MSTTAITNGSEKQVAWAEEIRAKFLEGCDHQERFARGRSDEAALASIAELRELAAATGDAQFWIRHRDNVRRNFSAVIGDLRQIHRVTRVW